VWLILRTTSLVRSFSGVKLTFIFLTLFNIALWSNNLLDTDKTMESFYTGCADAGPDRCAFWAPSPDDIRQNLTKLYDSISVQPVPVKTGDIYGYVDYKMLYSLVFAPYIPHLQYILFLLKA
jgi:hypothetical protein